MMIVDTALKKRQEEGRPVRVGMIGAGFMGSGVVLQITQSTPGMELVAIAARKPQRAIDAYAEAGRTDTVSCETRADIERAIADGKAAVTEDAVAMAGAEGIDVLLDVTGSMDHTLKAVLEAINARKHVVLMNAELDGTVGPYLKALADRAGVVITNVDGDQPGVQMNLYRFVQGIGVKPVVCGNIKGLQDQHRTPDTQRGFAEKWGQNVNMVTSFADGTKIAYEQAIVANGTGMTVARRGMIGPDPTDKDPTQPLRNLEEFVDMLAPHIDPAGPGIVDFVVGARPGPGVFVLGTHDNPRQQHYLNLYKLGAGPYYLFYTPYHLCHFEVPMTIARAALFQDAALTPLAGPSVAVITRTKKAMKAGETLDDIGGFAYYGECEKADIAARENLLPVGLAQGCRLKRDIGKDTYLTFADVDVPKGRLIDTAFEEQQRMFGLAPETVQV